MGGRTCREVFSLRESAARYFLDAGSHDAAISLILKLNMAPHGAHCICTCILDPQLGAPRERAKQQCRTNHRWVGRSRRKRCRVVVGPLRTQIETRSSFLESTHMMSNFMPALSRNYNHLSYSRIPLLDSKKNLLVLWHSVRPRRSRWALCPRKREGSTHWGVINLAKRPAGFAALAKSWPPACRCQSIAMRWQNGDCPPYKKLPVPNTLAQRNEPSGTSPLFRYGKMTPGKRERDRNRALLILSQSCPRYSSAQERLPREEKSHTSSPLFRGQLRGLCPGVCGRIRLT